MVGGIAYLATYTQPDLTFAVTSLARHLQEPTSRHLLLVNRVLRYVAGTISYGLLLRFDIQWHQQAFFRQLTLTEAVVSLQRVVPVNIYNHGQLHINYLAL